MKNLNIVIEKSIKSKSNLIAFMPMKWIYSLCAILCFLTCSFSTKAQHNIGSGYDDIGFYKLPGMGIGDTVHYEEVHYNGSSPLINNYGQNGSDKWMKVTLKTSGYLTISCGSPINDLDPVLHLLDSSLNVIDSNDDNGSSILPYIGYYLSAGDYFIILDGTDTKGHNKNGGVNIILDLY